MSFSMAGLSRLPSNKASDFGPAALNPR